MWLALAGGVANVISYSYDALHWTAFPSQFDQKGAYAAGWNGSMWLIGGLARQGHKFAYSYDAINWTSFSSVLDSRGDINDLKWNGTMWMACLGYGAQNAIAYSYDGLSWIGVATPYDGNFDRGANALAPAVSPTNLPLPSLSPSITPYPTFAPLTLNITSSFSTTAPAVNITAPVTSSSSSSSSSVGAFPKLWSLWVETLTGLTGVQVSLGQLSAGATSNLSLSAGGTFRTLSFPLWLTVHVGIVHLHGRRCQALR